MFIAAGFAVGQASTTVYQPDVNGNQVAAVGLATSTSGSSSERTELSSSINGRLVPLEKQEERVLSQTADSKVTERTISKFDQNGTLISVEKVKTEQIKHGDGSSTTHVETFHSDVNGAMAPTGRETTESRTVGTTTTTNTLIEKPSMSGTFETAEKRESVKQVQGDTTNESETVYRRDTNGSLVTAEQRSREEKKTNGTTVENVGIFTPSDNGRMQLQQQHVTTTAQNPDGSMTIDSTYFSRDAMGAPQSTDGTQHPYAQQTIARSKDASGNVVETMTVRHPTISNPDRLGDPQQVSKIVCTGKCDAPATPVVVP